MLRWMGSGPPKPLPDGGVLKSSDEHLTDDPLAAIDPERKGQGIYSVSRSVYLPRVALRSVPSPGDGLLSTTATATTTAAGNCGGANGAGEGSDNLSVHSTGVNPLFMDTYDATSHKNMKLPQPPRKQKQIPTLSTSSRRSTPSGEKSSSSGYGGSHGYSTNELIYSETTKFKEDALKIIEQNTNYVKSIQVGVRSNNSRKSSNKNNKSTHSSGSSGTLSTIPEGRIDFTIPRPIWPGHLRGRTNQEYDSLVDEAMLLYTSLNRPPESIKTVVSDVSVKEVLLDLLGNINATMEGKGVLTPEEMLKRVNVKIAESLDALKNVTEEEMRLLCINLQNSKNVSTVMRAFSNSSTSGNSSQSSPEWSARIRTFSSDTTEDLYHIPSGSSSSGFSESKHFDINTPLRPYPEHAKHLPMFVHEDLASVPNGVRNAMIYGTLCRGYLKTTGGAERLLLDRDKSAVEPKKSLLKAGVDSKPSVWEQYYGVNVSAEDDAKIGRTYVPRPSDVPVFPGGRPEADFTLDVPRSELLSKRMKEDKKWRCRCRLLTSFLGLVFFLLSVMAVSLMLTRGRRMFGSMV